MIGAPYSFLNRMLADTGGSAEIVHVTNLNASGPGSFVEAILGGSESTVRIVVFDVSGHIPLDHTRYEITRGNLVIAGETAPDPGDGTGRGVVLHTGRLRIKAKHTVIRHLHIFASDALYDPAGDPLPGNMEAVGYRFSGGDTPRHILQNVSMRGCRDEAMEVMSDSSSRFSKVAVADCLIPGALNKNVNDPNADFNDGHGYGPMQGAGTQETLWLRNLLASGSRRMPQLGGPYSDAIVCNNYIFNYGRHRASKYASVPFNVDFSNAAPDPLPPGTTGGYNGQVSGFSNYAEGGRRTDPWDYPGMIYYDRFSAIEVYRDGGDYIVTYYDQDGILTGSDAWLSKAKNTQLRDTIQGEWVGNVTPLSNATVLSSPHLAPPPTVLSAENARQAALQHAGAFSAQRNQYDQQEVIDKVVDKTHDHRQIEPSTTPISTRTGAPPSLPGDPWTVEANGLTKLENALNQFHLAAGGYPDYSAAEWFDR